MRLYLAGPMRGYPFYNADAFRRAAERIRAEGDEVVSPVEIDEAAGLDFAACPTGTEALPEGFDLPTLIRRDLDAIDTCDAILLLPGWEKSSGAAVELAYANFVGKQVFIYEEEA